MFLLRMRRQEKVQQQADELRSILDNQDAWSYIIDPDTFRLNYVNGKLARVLPQAGIGMPCYQALEDRNSPCEYCPALTMGNATNGSYLQYLRNLNCHVLTEASKISWEGREACLITSRKLPNMQLLEETMNISKKHVNETQSETSV